MCAFFSLFLSHPFFSSHWATVSYIADFSCSLQGPLCLPGLILLQHCRALFTNLWAFLYVVASTRVQPWSILLASFMTLLMISQSANFLSSGTGLQTHIFGWIQWASSQCPVWSYPNWAWQLYFTEGTVSSNSTQIFLYPSIMCTSKNDLKHLWILKQAIVKVSAWSKRERSPA